MRRPSKIRAAPDEQRRFFLENRLCSSSSSPSHFMLYNLTASSFLLAPKHSIHLNLLSFCCLRFFLLSFSISEISASFFFYFYWSLMCDFSLYRFADWVDLLFSFSFSLPRFLLLLVIVVIFGDIGLFLFAVPISAALFFCLSLLWFSKISFTDWVDFNTRFFFSYSGFWFLLLCSCACHFCDFPWCHLQIG